MREEKERGKREGRREGGRGAKKKIYNSFDKRKNAE